ncbi:hypothetical protein R1sor_007793 [Riccia sorocarpa]|uniref:Uncharacterized protein n=1 Tax=Riccia sorocarpa TaxID=122646 RepID=A0ABD3HRI1_9MARC
MISTSVVKPFRAADIFINITVKKSKAKWFVREALHVFGARSIFLQSSKKDPVNTGFVVHIGQEKDQVDVLVQNEKELLCYELLLKNIQIREFSIPLQKVLGPELNVDALGEYLVADPKWKFVERDSVKLALRLGILKPPQGSKAQDMLPHNKEWDSYKAPEEARLKAQATQREDPPEEIVEDDPVSKIVSPKVDRAKKKRNDGGSQRDSFLSIPKPPPGTRRPRSSAPSSSHATTSEPSDSQGAPEYMVPENTPAEEIDSEGEEPFPVTQTPKVQPLSALSEVELNRDEKNQIRRVAITRCLVDQSVLRIPIEQFHVPSCDSNSENWGPYQIRACSRSFVSDLKKHMQSNAYAHYHNFILLVDPRDCKDKASWVFPPPSKWRFYVIGGNHSALARMELLAQYPGIYTHYRHYELLYSFEKSFDLMLKDRSSSNAITKALFGVDEPEPEGGKRKRASKAKSLVQVLPPEFLDHIDSARAYKETKEAGRAVSVPDQNYKHWVKEGKVTRGHKHSKDVAPPTCDGEASLVDMSVPVTVDDVIRLEKDQVPRSAGTGGSEADDGTEDPEAIDPGVHAEETEEPEEEVPEHERRLGEEGIVPDSIVAE